MSSNKYIAALTVAFFLAATSAVAQSVQQSGQITPNSIPHWVSNGVIGGGITAADSPATSFGVTSNTTAGICVSSGRSTAAGRQQLCLGAPLASNAIISLQNYGTATAKGLDFIINGVTVTLPTGGGDFVTGVGPYTAGGIPCFTSTSAIIQDCGLTAASGVITAGTWNGTTIALANGGTGATTAATARTALGLGTMATQGSAAVAITGGTITGMPSPSASTDVANKSYVDSTATGLNLLASSTLATAAVLPNSPSYANGTLGVGATLTAGSNTTLTVDGTAAPLTTVVLVKNQAAPAQNGIYTVTTAGDGSNPWVLTRATYFDQAAEMKAGSYTFITSGSTNSNKAYTLQTAVTTVGSDSLTWSLFSSASAATTIAGNSGNFTLTQPLTNSGNALLLNASIQPQGRLTLVSGTPIMRSSVASAATVYYTPYQGNLVPIYDGTNMIPTAFSEVSQDLSDTTKSPAAVVASTPYDIFCWVDTGPVNRCTRGPAWTSATNRSAGTLLTLTNGIYLNTSTITNGPAALRGTYVGTIYANSSALVDYIYGSTGSGGVAAVFGIWNAFNRISVSTTVKDSTASWTYANGSAGWRQANGSPTMLVQFIRGLDEDGVSASYSAIGTTAVGSVDAAVGVGLGSTSSPTGGIGLTNDAVHTTSIQGNYSDLPGPGLVRLLALEYASPTSSWLGGGSFIASLRQ